MVTNKLEIRIVALKRTGHHAIIEWILNGISGKRVFINNSRPGKPVFYPDWILKRPAYRLVTHGFDDYDLSRDIGGDLQEKDALVYNYENWPLPVVFPKDLDTARQKLVGRSERIVDMMVCRDPLNNAASYIKKTSHKHTLSEFREWMALWCDYAEVAINGVAPDGRSIVPVHYSLWLTSDEYRVKIADQLGIENAPMPEQTAKWGDGSSFAQGEIDKKVTDKEALKLRWLSFEDDPTFRELFSNERVVDVSRRYLEHINDQENQKNFERFLNTLSS